MGDKHAEEEREAQKAFDNLKFFGTEKQRSVFRDLMRELSKYSEPAAVALFLLVVVVSMYAVIPHPAPANYVEKQSQPPAALYCQQCLLLENTCASLACHAAQRDCGLCTSEECCRDKLEQHGIG